MSETATDVMHRTRGSLKLGGNPKDMLPIGLITAMAEKGVQLPPELAGGNSYPPAIDFLQERESKQKDQQQPTQDKKQLIAPDDTT